MTAETLFVSGVRTKRVEYTFSANHGFRKHQTISIKLSSTVSAYTGIGRVVSASGLKLVLEFPSVLTFGTAGATSAAEVGGCYAFVCGASWTKSESGTNTAAYRPAGTTDSGSVPCSLSVDDTTLAYSKVRGFETTLSPTTGDGAFPSVAQASSYVIPKSDSTTPTNWILVADGQLFYFFATYSQSYKSYFGSIFGYPKTRMASDEFGCMINAWAGASGAWGGGCFSSAGINTNSYPVYFARSFSQIGSSVTGNLYGSAICGFGNGGDAFPSPIDNALNVSPVYIFQVGMRSVLKGILQPLHKTPLAGVGFYDGLAEYPEQTIMSIPTAQGGYTSAPDGEVHIVINGLW